MLDRLAPRCTFPDRSHLDCAVSGGADSCALLVLALHSGHSVTAHHVDHGIRRGSDAEAAIVRGIADRFGAGFASHTVKVSSGQNLEARAREMRYGVLPDGVLTGHTADDHAETVLLHLMRGGGLDGAAGIRQENRPILGLRRSETHDLCAALDIDVVDDVSNNDPRFRRNRVRAEVIPLLNEVAERDVVPLLARAADTARVDVDLLNDLAREIDVTDVAAIKAAPLALQRRAIRLWLSLDHPPSAAAVERVLAVVEGSSRSTEVGGGRSVHRTEGKLRVELTGGAGELASPQ